MGNYASCKLANPLHIKNSKSTTKVIFPTGEIKQINQPTKAAELMMETPNFFITNSKTMKIGKRFCPLNADDDLQKGAVYIMFPMHKKNSFVTASDLGSLFMTANSAVKRVSSGRVRVLPDDTKLVDDDEVVVPRLSLEGMEEVSMPEFRHRISMSRSRKPLLETIDEEPVRSRR
ncbi:uncharacterized protein LOC8265010 [Ricinus communis]|uniref:DUF4228 domain-containing protein n=1 Tax=Ricinus communis TaxID=3988 RepID=B9SPY4_RICCO|nr:uncharacterized protein LOC8265010 [Ricinus communis]EEF34303.1 conserved hypothetical protein [Ricinus communis]|eukprot:XP_002528053.1 uncharacterized protein LOC8265010 [Ricinus communis]